MPKRCGASDAATGWRTGSMVSMMMSPPASWSPRRWPPSRCSISSIAASTDFHFYTMNQRRPRAIADLPSRSAGAHDEHACEQGREKAGGRDVMTARVSAGDGGQPNCSLHLAAQQRILRARRRHGHDDPGSSSSTKRNSAATRFNAWNRDLNGNNDLLVADAGRMRCATSTSPTLRAGADIVETNTFSVDRDRAGRLRHGRRWPMS